MRNLTKEEWNKFHHHLVNEVAEFLHDKDVGNDSWIFELTIDDIPNLIRYKKWTPMNDSYMGIRDTNGNEIIWEM